MSVRDEKGDFTVEVAMSPKRFVAGAGADAKSSSGRAAGPGSIGCGRGATSFGVATVDPQGSDPGMPSPPKRLALGGCVSSAGVFREMAPISLKKEFGASSDGVPKSSVAGAI